MPTTKRTKTTKPKVLTTPLPHSMRLLKRVPGVFYKFFNSEKVASSWSCGFDDCPHADHVEKTTQRLVSPFANNRELQKAGDVGVPAGRVSMCSVGWHAIPEKYLRLHGTKLQAWAVASGGGTNNRRLWCVTLYGSMKKDGEKVAARGIRMEYEVPYESPEGKRLWKLAGGGR